MSSKLPAWLVLAAKWVQRFWLPCCRCSLWAWFYCQNFLWNKLSNNLANSFVSGIIYVLAQCLDLGPSTRFSSRVCWSATWCYSRKLEWLVKQSDKRWRCPKMPREIQKDWSFSKKKILLKVVGTNLFEIFQHFRLSINVKPIQIGQSTNSFHTFVQQPWTWKFLCLSWRTFCGLTLRSGDTVTNDRIERCCYC